MPELATPSVVRMKIAAPASCLTFEAAAGLVRAYLCKYKCDPIAAAIFGSVAKERNHAKSDIDVLLISSSPALAKRNIVFCGRRMQFIEGSSRAIQQRIADVYKSKNDFIISVVMDSRWVSGDQQSLIKLKEAAAPILKSGMPPLSHEQYLSIRCRCADAIEKIESAADANLRMFAAHRIFTLLHELAAASGRVSLHAGTASYTQFIGLAPQFATAMAAKLRKAIIQDDYRDLILAVRSFFDKTGGFAWECDTPLPI